MEHTAVFQEQVALTPQDMRKEIKSFDDVLLSKLQTKLEGRCSRHGFVVPGTVKLLSRSMGVVEKGRFTGSTLFYLQAEGTVLNPPDGAIVEGEVTRKNKMGMYVSYQVKTADETMDAINIIVPRDLHIGNTEYEGVEIGARVKVEIKKSRFQVNDPFILSVGIYQGTVSKGNARRAAGPPVPPPQVAESGAEEVLEEATAPAEEPVQEGGEGEEDKDEGEDEGEDEENEDADFEDEEEGDEEVE
jgi:DNA-directed RNA polymerase subunit E'/Rpb7